MKKIPKNTDLMIYNFILVVLLVGFTFYVFMFFFKELKSIVFEKTESDKTIHFNIREFKELNLIK